MKVKNINKVLLVSIIIFGALIRVVLLPLPGNSSDVATFVRFADQVLKFGPQSLYEPTDLGQVQGHFTYPPLFPMILAGSFWVERAILRLLWQPSEAAFGAASSQLDDLVVKGWAVAGDAFLAWFAWREVCRFQGQRSATVVVAAILWSPAIAYAGAYWGQIDALLAAVVVAAVSSMLNRQWWLVGAWVSVGMLLKPQMVVAVPIVVLGTVILGRLGGAVRAGCASLGVGAMLTLPFWATGRFGVLASAYLHAAGAYPAVTVNADNIWTALCSLPLGLSCGSDSELLVWGLTYRQVGLLCLSVYVTFVLFLLARPFMILSEIDRKISSNIELENNARGIVFVGMSLVFFAFFMLPTQVHERYLLPAIALMSILVNYNKEYRIIYSILSFNFLLNLISVVTISATISRSIQSLGFTPQNISWINCIVFVIMLFDYIENLREKAFEKQSKMHGNSHMQWILSATMCVSIISIESQVFMNSSMFLTENTSIWIIITCAGIVFIRLWFLLLEGLRNIIISSTSALSTIKPEI